jgi:hypothetical protein
LKEMSAVINFTLLSVASHAVPGEPPVGRIPAAFRAARTPDCTRDAAHGDTGPFFGNPDVDPVYAYLRAKGIDVKKPIVKDYGMKPWYLKDPDGYGICFQWRAA